MAEWQQVMTVREFEAWKRFYLTHPFDDAHRYHRPAALISQSMGGGSMAEKLKWLQGEMQEAEPEEINGGEYSAADLKTFAALGMKPPGV